MPRDRCPLVEPTLVERYVRSGWWGADTVGAILRRRAADTGGDPAIIVDGRVATWADYDGLADHLAAALNVVGVEPGTRVGVLLTDGLAVHAAYVAVGRAGATAVGLGVRGGRREHAHLLAASGARTLVTAPTVHAVAAADLVAELRAAGAQVDRLVVVDESGGTPEVWADDRRVPPPSPAAAARLEDERCLGPDDLFLVNSTSGTTGLPKRVRQFENRWFYFHQLVVDAIDLQGDDVFLSLLPAPYGFGLWTAHFTPAVAGIPVVVTPRFRAGEAWDLVERYGVTVMAAVSTQFVMMLADPRAWGSRRGRLRAMFSGGEAVPRPRAEEFESRTGALVLQFYGSNETGVYSRTTVRDGADERLGTSGRVVEAMEPRLYDGERDITATGGPGQPACRGPATCAGYDGDDEANRRLYTPDGWMLMEDMATVDENGYVHLVGRRGDFIIRGGKNISAAAVEEAVSTHPAVALAAAVPVPDDVFGERVGVFVALREGGSLRLDQLVAHLDAHGFTRETFPEHLYVVDTLPTSSGGKVAKHLLRDQVIRP